MLDIGARVIKAGYSGEAQPRVIVSSVAQATPPEGKGEAMGAVSDDLLWSIDICRCKDESEYRRALYALKGRLTFLLRKTLYKYVGCYCFLLPDDVARRPLTPSPLPLLLLYTAPWLQTRSNARSL